MSASTSLTTLADLKSYLGLSDVTHDTLLTALIARASEAIERYCSREFAQVARTEYYDGRGVPRLVLRQRPVAASPAPVVYDDPAREFGADSAVRAGDIILHADEGIIELALGVFSDGSLNVKVTYTAGYATIPTPLAQACILLAAALFHRGQQGADGVASESHAGAYSVTYAGMLITPEIRELLDPFREIRI